MKMVSVQIMVYIIWVFFHIDSIDAGPNSALQSIESYLKRTYFRPNSCRIISNMYNGKDGKEMLNLAGMKTICDSSVLRTKVSLSCQFIFDNPQQRTWEQDVSFMFTKAIHLSECQCTFRITCCTPVEGVTMSFMEKIAKIAEGIIRSDNDVKKRITGVCQHWSKLVELCQRGNIHGDNLEGCRRLQLRE